MRNATWQNLGSRAGFNGFWLRFRGRRTASTRNENYKATYSTSLLLKFKVDKKVRKEFASLALSLRQPRRKKRRNSGNWKVPNSLPFVLFFSFYFVLFPSQTFKIMTSQTQTQYLLTSQLCQILFSLDPIAPCMVLSLSLLWVKTWRWGFAGPWSSRDFCRQPDLQFTHSDPNL